MLNVNKNNDFLFRLIYSQILAMTLAAHLRNHVTWMKIGDPCVDVAKRVAWTLLPFVVRILFRHFLLDIFVRVCELRIDNYLL